MADETAPVQPPVTFGREPASYRHWKLAVDGTVATLTMAVTAEGGLRDDYDLKLNSYDLGVDIELYDAVQRLRFEHPGGRAVVVTGGLDKVFCAGANIQMLAGSSHHHKVNFCKFTNETRNSIEDATEHSQQVWLAAVNGTAAGGGYELALACDEIILVDDRSSAVSLPEVPLLGVLPGTGGLTRVVDKRGVRRDLADVFATRTEGVQGAQALDWGLVDSLAPRSGFDDHVRARAEARGAASDRPADAAGITLTPLERTDQDEGFAYRYVDVTIDRASGAAHITITVPGPPDVTTDEEVAAAGDAFWPLAACRELDETILYLRFNEPEVGTWVLRTQGETAHALAWDDLLRTHAGHWLVREITLYWKRTLKRLDLSARTLVTLVEPGGCFAGTLTELVLAADRSFMLDGTFEDDDRPAATITLGDANRGWYPMSNGLTRIESRFWGHPELVDAAHAAAGTPLLAAEADKLGLVTFTPDDIDWEDEVRLTLEERASFSPDALTGLEANYRFVGPETLETKIFGRLTAWQNWIFQRPNASGPEGALRRFGTGSRPAYDRRRV
jgi:benzoyl-CoA-dihydrodiol lyase